MAMRKHILTAIFVVLLAVSYFYITNRYNIKAVEYDFEGQLSKTDIEAISKSLKNLPGSQENKDISFIINFADRYRGSKLIMTTGMDYMAKDIPIAAGRFLISGEVPEAVLGDVAADKFFRNSNAVGAGLSIYGKEYKVVGVIKNSDEIFISYDENSKVEWSKKSIKFIVKDIKGIYLDIELLEGMLKSLGLDAASPVVYKQEAYGYVNIILILVIYILSSVIRRQWRKTDRQGREIYSDYKMQSRTTELHKYIIRSRRKIASYILKLLKIAALLALIIMCVKLLQIPPRLIPANLFAPSSYIEVVRMNLRSYTDRLENGISGILMETHMINLVLMAYLVMAFIVNRRASILKD
ncbi:MAG: hypothetical protein K0R84_2030 [Clostridia bacterium]|nr:hypothetical protein [Clostridia bacterium]